VERKQLSQLGFVSDLSEFPADYTDKILAVDDKWREIERKKQEQENRKRSRKR